jgi:hypothetical protein
VKEKEAEYNKYWVRGKSWVYPDIPRCFNLLGEVKEESTIGLSLTTPGPQFLHFLEQDLLDIGSDPNKKLLVVRGVPSYENHGREKVVIDGKAWYFKFTANGGWRPFSRKGLDKRSGQVEDGQWVSHNDQNQFPRELIWFYGVERLRITDESGEAEDWKKLPMLLWE